MKNKDEILEKLNKVFDKISDNRAEAWDDDLATTKSVVIVENFRGIEYNEWIEDLNEVRNLIEKLL